MLKYFIQVIQNLFITLTLLSLLFAAARSLNLPEKWRSRLSHSVLSGIILSLLLAFLKITTNVLNREYINITILSIAVITTFFLFTLLWRRRKADANSTTAEIFSQITIILLAFCLTLYALPDIFLYPTGFAMPGETIFNTDVLFKSVGYLFGLFAVFIAAFAVYKVALALPVAKLRWFLLLLFSLNLLSQLAAIIQFLVARRILPLTKASFSFVKLTVNHSEYFLFAELLVILAFAVFLWLSGYRKGGQTFENPARKRLFKINIIWQKRWSFTLLLFLTGIFLSQTLLKTYAEQSVALSPPEPMNIVGTDIVLPLENVNDGHLHRYVYTAVNGTHVRFIVIKKQANAYGVGLDACDICGPTGYYERGANEVVCKLCDVVMNINTIGFKGGCNPVPLPYSLNEGKMIIQIQELEKERKRFE